LLLFDYRVALTILVVFLCGLAATRKSLFPPCSPAAVCHLRTDGSIGWFDGNADGRFDGDDFVCAPEKYRRRNRRAVARRGVAPKPESTKL